MGEQTTDAADVTHIMNYRCEIECPNRLGKYPLLASRGRGQLSRMCFSMVCYTEPRLQFSLCITVTWGGLEIPNGHRSFKIVQVAPIMLS